MRTPAVVQRLLDLPKEAHTVLEPGVLAYLALDGSPGCVDRAHALFAEQDRITAARRKVR